MQPDIVNQHIREVLSANETLFELTHVDPEIPQLTHSYIVASLLDEPNVDVEEEGEGEQLQEEPTFRGIPSQPLIDNLVSALIAWESTTELCLPSEPISLLNEDETHRQQLESCKPLLDDYFSSPSTESMRLFLAQFGVRGILSLVGLRKTVGSISYFPPSPSELVRSFNSLHKKQPVLTVGAVALSKHCVRSAHAFWGGQQTGNVQAKVDKANIIHEKILNEAVWINSHVLPHKIVCLEIRVKEGYGARYVYTHFANEVILSNAVEFRGFLEPPMVDGHEKKWRH